MRARRAFAASESIGVRMEDEVGKKGQTLVGQSAFSGCSKVVEEGGDEFLARLASDGCRCGLRSKGGPKDGK